LLDKFIVTADYKKQTKCRWLVGTELYLVAWEGYGSEENWQPYENIGHDLIIEFERQNRESVLTAHAEDEAEDEANDDLLMEVDVDESEFEQVALVQIVKHSLQWPDKTCKGGLWSVWVKLEYSDGSRTDGLRIREIRFRRCQRRGP